MTTAKRPKALTPSVAKLARTAERALAKGDEAGLKASLETMMRVALREAEGYTSDDSETAFIWIADRDGGLLNGHIRRLMSREPQLLVGAVKAMRRVALESPDPKKRKEALAALKQHGFDDESLRKEDAR